MKYNQKTENETNPNAPQLESEPFTGIDEASIVKTVISDYELAIELMRPWVDERELDIKHYDGKPPSELENLTKKAWQADRNLGLCRAICDSYQATLIATCWNPDTLHFVADEHNDSERGTNIEKFSKWMVSDKECDIYQDIFDFIHTRITNGTSCFKIYWKCWYEWVDERIPVYDKQGKLEKYRIETKHKRFERAFMDNIDNISDILTVPWGDNIQTKPFVIHVLRKTAEDLMQESAKNIYRGIDDDYIKSLKQAVYDDIHKRLGDEKARNLGFESYDDVKDSDGSACEILILEAYRKIEVHGKFEEYRIHVDPIRKKLLGIKPLRKITRTGKRPFVGGAFARRPGFWHGDSMPHLISDIVNQFNSTFNQKNDFQYVENCPYGFYTPDEEYQRQEYDLTPGTMYPASNPNDINITRGGRSFAWAESDYRILNEVLEKITGAAAYFMSNTKNVSGTATRDTIVNQKSETRFGMWERTIREDICEGITMLLNYYQDYAPPYLPARIIGKDGKSLFTNFSIDTIRGSYRARMVPDIIAGSKTMERQIALWALEMLSQTIWLSPQINPNGNWNLVRDAAKKMGVANIDQIMPPEPPKTLTKAQDIEDLWNQLMQGIIPEIKPMDDNLRIYFGISAMKEDKWQEVDDAYKPNIDLYLYKLSIAVAKQFADIQKQQMVNQLTTQLIAANEMRGNNAGNQDIQPLANGGTGGMGVAPNVKGMGAASQVPSASGGQLPGQSQ